jgi:hypothetical protein
VRVKELAIAIKSCMAARLVLKDQNGKGDRHVPHLRLRNARER